MILMLALLGAISPPAVTAAVPSIRSVTAAPAGTGLVITVQLTGPVKPSAGKLIDNPSRLYFDLPGAVPGKQRILNIERGAVSHVRIGMNQPAPPVTRVVIELSAKVRWRIEPGASAAEVRVILEDAVPASSGRVFYQPAPESSPAVDRRSDIRADLFRMQTALDAMAAWTGPSDADLAVLIESAERMSAAARGLRITGAPADLALSAAIDAVLTAGRARAQALADGAPQSRANAIAAANGASLLISEVSRVTRGSR